jgi:cell wall-associated NlpC family hydrolase
MANTMRREVIAPVADLRRTPSHDAPLDSQALLGERVIVHEVTDEGWARGELATDGYAGWLPASALAPEGPPPTHRVMALTTLAFAKPDIKTPPLALLPMSAVLAVTRQDDRFAVTAANLHIPVVHLAPLATTRPDFVAVAEQFLGTPYLWGGKTALGLDCSGLVQVALQAAGISCPRDSGPQEQALGTPIQLPELRRGDLVFWKGHVAIARDSTTLIHANAHAMAVAIEPLADAVARIKAAGSDVTSVKRLLTALPRPQAPSPG